MNNKDFFVAIYTNECKSYCDKEFIRSLAGTDIISHGIIYIADNTVSPEYSKRLQEIASTYFNGEQIKIDHVQVDIKDADCRFLINVTDSANYLREKFLDGPYKYFLILESDVVPETKDICQSFLEVIDQADVIGGLYYHGFHGPNLWARRAALVPQLHVLSGCTLYKREVLERFPFRWSYANRNAFPDAWMSIDAHDAGFRLANYTKIRCQHLCDVDGGRGQANIK